MPEPIDIDSIFSRVEHAGSASMPLQTIASAAEQSQAEHGTLSIVNNMPPQPAAPEIHIHVSQPPQPGRLPAPRPRHGAASWLVGLSLFAAAGSVVVYKNQDTVREWLHTTGVDGSEPGSSLPNAGDPVEPAATKLADCVEVPEVIDGKHYDQPFLFCYKATGQTEVIHITDGLEPVAEKIHVQLLDSETGAVFSPLKIESLLTDANSLPELGQLEAAVNQASKDGGITSRYLSFYLVDADGLISRLTIQGRDVNIWTEGSLT